MSFPVTFPWHFGGYSPAPGLESMDGTALAWITSHCEDGKALLLSQFRDKPRIEAVLCALLDGVQDLDDAIWQVLTQRSLDTAVGVFLDRIGKIVGLPRRGWPDATYRALLRAQILVLRSDATWPTIFAILDALGYDVMLIQVAETAPASMTIELGQLSPIDSLDVFNFLERARGAAVRLELLAPTTDLADTFTFASDSSPEASSTDGAGDSLDSSVGGELTDLFASSVDA